MKTILTYGTFDLFHIGHLNVLERLSSMGDRLVVGVSTDEFNAQKGKRSLFDFEARCKIINGLSCVDSVIAEYSWEQKIDDINKYQVSIFGIGEDWHGIFDHLKAYCEVIYLPRTESISTTALKDSLSKLNADKLSEIKQGLDDVMALVKAME